MSTKKITHEELTQFLNEKCGPNTKIYIGCDSERFRFEGTWYADYTIAIVIHINSRNGAKIFAEVNREKDYDQKVNRPYNRMMAEAKRVAETYLKYKEIFYDYEVETHLDINPKLNHGSSCAANAAIGYIRGMCNVVPLLKPSAFAASYAADRAKEIMGVKAS